MERWISNWKQVLTFWTFIFHFWAFVLREINHNEQRFKTDKKWKCFSEVLEARVYAIYRLKCIFRKCHPNKIERRTNEEKTGQHESQTANQ